MTRKVTEGLNYAGLMSIVGLMWLSAATTAAGQSAETFYISDVESIVQGKCIACHRSGGQAASSGADLLFTSSAGSNHAAFDSYVNSPTLGAKASRVLSKIAGGSGHGGGQVISQGSADYQTFSDYMDLLSADEQPADPGVLRVALEEPIEGQVHTGVGNLRGWAVASEGITKVEILIDGVVAFEAPYGGSRGDVGGAFPDVEGSRESGFSLAYNYSGLAAGLHTVTAVAYNASGETEESSASFEVVRFESPFIADPNAVRLGNASCMVSSDEISIVDARVDGSLLDLVLKWRTAEQGFEIVEIR
jgi:hypothetical protein